VKFYDDLFSVISVKILWKHSTMAAWGKSRESSAFCVIAPFDGDAANVENGVMIALKMED
jgi:hypothetical protein